MYKFVHKLTLFYMKSLSGRLIGSALKKYEVSSFKIMHPPVGTAARELIKFAHP
uniref:Ribosomal_L30 domain-containing protein n=1 Tax=Hydatigena taeniaeformis TaxID=6205 RepID=A0A0R3X1P4_HYDTA